MRSSRAGLVAGGLVPALLLGAVAVSASGPRGREALAAPPPAQPIDAFCAEVQGEGGSPFRDDDGHTFEAAVGCLAASGVTTGGPGGLPPEEFGPDLQVSRGQMASFIAREIDTANRIEAAGGVGELPAYDGSNDFRDVPSGNVHLEAINRLVQAGVVQGGPGGRPAEEFGPDLPVSRAQMATFVNRAHGLLAGAPLSSAVDHFTDDAASPHEGNINGIASEGIAVGDGNVSYDPGRSVTRGQMAAFIVRHLAVLEELGLVTTLPAAAGFSPFADDGSATLPAHVQEPEAQSAPAAGEGEPVGERAGPQGASSSTGEEEPPEQDPCSLVTAAEFAALTGGSAQQHVLEAGDACGYTGGDDTLRLAVALIAAGPGARWLDPGVASVPLEVAGHPARWATGYPVEESSLLVVELEGHDLALEISSLGRQHGDDQLRDHAVELAGIAIGRYQP